MSDARELAAQWKDRADDCGRLARSVLGSELAAARASSPPSPGLVEAARSLAAISVSDHVYEGSCPDELQPDARDPACPMCRVVDAIAALRAALPKETP